MLRREHQQRRGKEICAERNGRDRIDLARLRIRAVEQSGHEQRGDQHEAGDGVERMRSNGSCRDRVVQAGEHPQRAERDRRDREPAPQPRACERERGGGDDREIDVERPVVRRLGGDEQRRDEGADLAERSERRPVQQRGGERRERHDAEQHEGGAGHEEVVERVGRVDRRVRDRGAGRGEDARDVRVVGDATRPTAISRRRVHSPAAISAVASRPPRKTRTPGPIRPASIEYCTRKMPPSASASPPIQTTQLAPKRSSKLFAGAAVRRAERAAGRRPR